MASAHLSRGDVLGSTLRRLLRRGVRGKISRLLARVRPEDVAVMLRDFTPAEQLRIFETLVSDYPRGATEVLVHLDPAQRLALFEKLTPRQIAKLLELAAVDDAVHILESLPPQLEEAVLEIVDLEERFADVQAQLTYREGSAGRVMDTDFLAIEEGVTVSQAIEKVRGFAAGEGLISYLYVVDDAGQLKGVVSLRQLLLGDPGATLRDIMTSSVIRVATDADEEEAAQLAARYDLLAVPVTDADNKLVGVVTVDDVIDIFREAATEDFYKLAGTSEDELIYQDRPARIAGIRLPWLLVNLVGLLIVASLTTRFQTTFQIALLVGFVPVIMGTGGNVASQTAMISVRGLATGRLRFGEGRIRSFLWKQLKVGAILGLTCTSIVLAVTFFLARADPSVALSVGFSLFVAVVLASTSGVLIPVFFKRIGFDPAIASGPLVTTLNDLFGILAYFGLATALLGTAGR